MDWATLGTTLARIGLPLLGGAVGGPAGAVVGQTLATALGLAADSPPDQIVAGLGTLSGEQWAKLRELEVSLARAELQVASETDKGQVELNKINARADTFFDRGWRPAVGWLCVMAFGYMAVVRPLLPWLFTLGGADAPPLPAIDTVEIAGILFGMLGLGSMRTMEKLRGRR